jgi:hypothetical protein
MSTPPLTQIKGSDRWTFRSPATLQTFLAIDYVCLARMKNAGKTEHARCQRRLSRIACSQVQLTMENVVPAGVPSRDAHVGLETIAKLCVHNAQDHGMVADGFGQSCRFVSQWVCIYNEWHRRLWAAYLGANGAAWIFPVPGPPPLDDERAWKTVLENPMSITQNLDFRQQFFLDISSDPRDAGPSGYRKSRDDDPDRDRDRESFQAHPVRRTATFNGSISILRTWGSKAKTVFSRSTREPTIERPLLVRQDQASRIDTVHQSSELRAIPDERLDDVHLEPIPSSGNPKGTPVTPVKTRNKGGAEPMGQEERVAREAGKECEEEEEKEEEEDEDEKTTAATPVSPSSSIASSAGGGIFSPGQRVTQETPVTGYTIRSVRPTSSIFGPPSSRPTSKRRLPSSISPLTRKAGRSRGQNREEDSANELDAHVDAIETGEGDQSVGDREGDGHEENENKPSSSVQHGARLQSGSDFENRFRGIDFTEDWDLWLPEKDNPPDVSYFKDAGKKSQMQVVKDIIGKLRDPNLTTEREKPKYIYGFVDPDAPGYAKIGSGEDPINRLQIWQKCGPDFQLAWVALMEVSGKVIEELIHSHLHAYRKSDTRCSGEKAEKGTR